MRSVISRDGRRFFTRTLHLAPSPRRRVRGRTIVDRFFWNEVRHDYFYTILYYSYVEKSAICGCGPKNPLDDDNKTRLEPYGTTTFGISNPVPLRGHIFAIYRGHGRQDGALASDERHGIVPKYGQEGETEFSLKD